MDLSHFINRRMHLLAQCEQNSIVIIPAANMVTRSNDTEYLFRQDSYFYYLTGFIEPDAFLVLSNRTEVGFRAVLFTQPKDLTAEIWQGRRLGVDAAPKALGVDIAYSVDDFDEILPELLNGHEHLYFQLEHNPQADVYVQSALATCRQSRKNALTPPRTIHEVNRILDAMRRVKSDAEIDVMALAGKISAQAHCNAMRACEPNKFEYHLEAELHYHFGKNSARNPAYNSIVGSGDNACILHYTENNQQLVDGDLVLIDAGCELDGYAADITRTFPVNGKFSDAQADIYDIVLDAQLAVIERVREGVTFTELTNIAIEVITKGLVELSIIKTSVDEAMEDDLWREFFMHGIGHYLGLDVHDVGVYKRNGQDIPLDVNTVITIEPGIYIQPDADVPEQYKGIGVRIEDNLVVLAEGSRNLTSDVPKTREEIEALMA